MAKRVVRKRDKASQELWRARFREKAATVHKRNLDKFAARMLKRCVVTSNFMVSRSKKVGVPCSITLEDIRELLLASYGTKCRYCSRQLLINNLVFDHVIPISKSGPSTRANTQVICRPCNTMKGSLNETNFKLLLDWLATVPPELNRDIRIRLARGFA